MNPVGYTYSFPSLKGPSVDSVWTYVVAILHLMGRGGGGGDHVEVH